MKTLVFLTIFLFGLVSSTVFAGQGGSGGVGFECGGKVYLADTFSSFYPVSDHEQNRDALTALANDPLEDVMKIVLTGLRSYLQRGSEDVQFQEIEEAYQQLHFVEVDSVPRTYDDHITNPPRGCSLIQLARQDKNGVVEVARAASQMKPIEQGLLRVHEIRLRWLINRAKFKGDTTPVRGWVDKFTNMSLADLIVPLAPVTIFSCMGPSDSSTKEIPDTNGKPLEMEPFTVIALIHSSVDGKYKLYRTNHFRIDDLGTPKAGFGGDWWEAPEEPRGQLELPSNLHFDLKHPYQIERSDIHLDSTTDDFEIHIEYKQTPWDWGRETSYWSVSIRSKSHPEINYSSSDVACDSSNKDIPQPF